MPWWAWTLLGGLGGYLLAYRHVRGLMEALRTTRDGYEYLLGVARAPTVQVRVIRSLVLNGADTDAVLRSVSVPLPGYTPDAEASE